MMNFLFSWGLSIAVLIPEFWFGNWGFFVPFSSACVLYFAMTTSWKNALFLALVQGLLIDSIYARPYPVATALLLTALLFQRQMLPEPLRERAGISVVCSGAFYAVFLEFSLCLIGDRADLWQNLLDIPLVVLARTAGFAIFVLCADAVARRIGASPYCIDLNENAPRHHGNRRVSQRTIVPERNGR